MKLLFDQNLSPKLVSRLTDLFHGSLHVQDVGLQNATDAEVWEYSRTQSLHIVSKDDDFQNLSVVRGHPPKVIWRQTGNTTTALIESLIRGRSAEILMFENDAAAGILSIR